MREILAPQLIDRVVPNRFDETEWLLAYLREGEPRGEALMLSLGEAWDGPPAGLQAALGRVPPEAHGYQLSMYGLPALRSRLARWVADTQRLPAEAEGTAYDVAVSWGGTRSSMADFGRWLLERWDRGPGTPTLVSAYPGWEYHGVFGPLGFRFAPYLLRDEEGFRPDTDALLRHLGAAHRSAGGAPCVVVLNAQHNPTCIDWPPEVVRSVVRFALQHGWALLLDDAHYGIHLVGTTPTSALRILLDEAGAHAPVPWLTVRSLGKEFACNGWGLGAMLAPPAILEELVLRIRPRHQYNVSGHCQHAMACWMDGPGPAEHSAEYRARVDGNRAMVAARLHDELGYPCEAIPGGTCTSFMLYPLPPAFRALPDGGARFTRACMERTGVLLSAGALAPPPEAGCAVPYVRLFIGAPANRVRESMDRIGAAGLGWGDPAPSA